MFCFKNLVMRIFDLKTIVGDSFTSTSCINTMDVRKPACFLLCGSSKRGLWASLLPLLVMPELTNCWLIRHLHLIRTATS